MSGEESKTAKTVLITGASSGIGLELATQLHAAGAEVYATVRKTSEGLEAVGVKKVITGIDVGDDAVIETLSKAVAGVEFDLVINNAGVFNMENFDSLDFDNAKRQFNINALGPLRVAKAVAGNVKKGGQIANISSMMASITMMKADSSMQAYSYRASKAALNMALVSLAAELKPKGVSVGIFHPGFVLTRMTAGFGDAGQISTTDSAKGLLAAMDKVTLENTGIFLSYTGDELPW